MMPRMFQSNFHISDLLPAYVTGRLDAASAERVRIHLETCAACRHELAAWEAVGGATQFASASMPAPSPTLMNAVWAKIDAQEKAVAQGWSISRVARHLWLVFTRQIPLIHKSIWIGLYRCIVSKQYPQAEKRDSVKQAGSDKVRHSHSKQ